VVPDGDVLPDVNSERDASQREGPAYLLLGHQLPHDGPQHRSLQEIQPLHFSNQILMIVSPYIISHFYVTIKTPLSYPLKEHDSSREDVLNEVLL
jgi:hypothetical protein